MQLGVDGVFVGSGIFKSGNPDKRAKAMVQAVTHYNDPKLLADVSEDLGEPMVGQILHASCDLIIVGKCVLYIGGTNGEFPTLNLPEGQQLTNFVNTEIHSGSSNTWIL